ncbi:hypothetical protein ACQKWADRAFT_309623 [Trichoderma austrokoningii]
MDIFGTVITAGGLILDFVGACAAYSDDAKALKARFEWDLRALKTIQDYFNQRQADNANAQLSPGDVTLLEQTADYLDSLVGKAYRSLSKIKRKGLLNGILNRGMWVARQAELKVMEREIYAWTQRFDVRVLGLPPELRAIIPTGAETGPPAVVKSSNRLRGFLDLASSTKQTRAKDMRLEDSDNFAKKIIGRGSFCFLPLQEGDRQLVFASRKVSQEVVFGTPAFEQLEFDMGVLAAALNCLDATTDIRLLKVESFFYHAETSQFIFTQVCPFSIVSTITLENYIAGDPFFDTQSTLDQRLKLALKLAESIFFLHTAGFVHKNVTSPSIVFLQRRQPSSSPLDDFYLMGFDLIREVDGRTSDKRVAKGVVEVQRPIWEYDIFQHPDRSPRERQQRYTKTHDVYSFGVVLLEIGYWEPLSEVLPDLDESNPSSWPRELMEAALALGPRTGESYQRLVVWCLGLDGSGIVKGDEFVEHVLDPLDEMVNALS